MNFAALICVFIFSTAGARFASASMTYPELTLREVDYNKLKSDQKKTYLSLAQKNYIELEAGILSTQKIASNNGKYFQNFGFFISTAFADNKFCMIGGAKMPSIGDKCSTKGNGCDENDDGFKCGKLFGETCIDRTPIETLSERCLKLAVPVADYKKFKDEFESSHKMLCVDTSVKNESACSRFSAKMQSLNSATVANANVNSAVTVKAAGIEPSPATPTAGAAVTPPIAPPEASEKCLMDTSKFKENLANSFVATSGRGSFRSASLDALEIWKKYKELEKSCSTGPCKKLFENETFIREMDPQHWDSTNGVAKSFVSDINALGMALQLTQKKIPKDRKDLDLKETIEKMGWSADGKFAAALKTAYLADKTFSGPTQDRLLMVQAFSLGKGRTTFKDDTYDLWLIKGEKNLKDLSLHLKAVVRDLAEKPAENQEKVAATKMLELVNASSGVTGRLKTGMTALQQILTPLLPMDPDCLKASKIPEFLASFNPIQPVNDSTPAAPSSPGAVTGAK